MEDDEFDEEDLVPDTKSKNQENRNRSHGTPPIDAIAKIRKFSPTVVWYDFKTSHFSMISAFVLAI